MDVRRATAEDVDAAVETITRAFRTDPIWGPTLALPDGSDEHLRPFWRFYVESGLQHQTLFVTDDAATVSVWIPPGQPELSGDGESALADLVSRTFDTDRAALIFELFDRFEAQHHHAEPYAYLSLLATRPDHAGHGYGQRHLATDLARWDELGAPCYLESTNPVNDRRYQRQGFATISRFSAVLDDAVVSTMWRPAPG